MPIGAPASSTTVIAQLDRACWNEFLFAVVLSTDEAKRTLPLGYSTSWETSSRTSG